MRILSCIVFIIVAAECIFPQSPHGNKLKFDCSNCHESTNWKIIPEHIKFNHNTETPFKLEGQHASVSCRSCHKSLIFSEAKSNCVSCHKDIHQNTLGTNCVTCHTPSSWIVTNIIQIHRNSRFPLLGVHLNVDCASCHSGYAKLYFPPQSVSCFSCHSKQYYAATFPNHVVAHFSTECQDCHNITDFSWGNGKIDHNFFPLTGGHNIANCFSCHKSGSDFNGLTTACYPCHQQNYVQAKNPDHIQAKFPTTCQDCHNTISFTEATFNHSTTGFALTGAHATVSCQSCHTSGYVNTPTDCYSCHSHDYAKTTDPNHAAQGFPHDCTQCHSTTSWSDANFDHSKTGFALTGAHITVSCQSCHASGYTNTSPVCYSCHQTNYQTASNPNHVAAGLPQTCQDCHNTTTFSASTFNHATTGFALTGAHVSLDCSSCHKGTVTGLTPDCYSCHSADYNGTTDPNHAAAGFPHDCTQCHSTSSWSGADFNHTAFPLTGSHNVSCTNCHINSSSFSVFSCITCHEHGQANTDPNHRGVNGYVYSATSCYSCHPTGRGGD